MILKKKPNKQNTRKKTPRYLPKKKRKKKERGNTTENTYILLGVTIRLLVDVDGLNTQYPNKILKIRCIYPTLGSKDTGRRRTKHNVYLLK
jgi:hypothetical protein